MLGGVGPKIETGYLDYRGEPVDVMPETLASLRTIFRSGARTTPVLAMKGEVTRLPFRGDLELENGGVLAGIVELPETVEPGYHRLRDDSRSTLVIVAPRRCHLPDSLKVWGWALQLYSLWSRASWGIGDLGDLRTFGAWARDEGAAVALLNPLHAALPLREQEPSPYFPSSRCFKNPIYLRIEDIPGGRGNPDVERLAAEGRALLESERVQRNEVWALKSKSLETLYAASVDDPAFDDFVQEIGRPLTDFSVFCALTEEFGSGWQTWPEEYRDRDSGAVRRFAAERADRVRFHSWLQWHLDIQFAKAAEELGLINDLAVGVDPAGADAWIWPRSFVEGASIGAPPDDYNAQGQQWGVTGFDPVGLDEDDFEAFIQMVRLSMRHAVGLRLDHVMGLFRLYWVPHGDTAAAGAYVRYPSDVLLHILALESERAGVFVIGEDLGTVEAGVREAMAERQILSYKLLWFMDDLNELQPLSMASANTHDLPTTAGLWTGSDLQAQEEAGQTPNVAFAEAILDRIRRHLDLPLDATVGQVVDASCRLLSRCDAAVVTVAIEDALETLERINQPGTSGEWNWSARSLVPLDEFVNLEKPRRIAEIFGEAR
jgi:4-alpha-glucanotransferase